MYQKLNLGVILNALISVIFLLLISCSNTKEGIHNADLQNRHRIVMKQDKIMKKSMQKARKKAMPKQTNKMKQKRFRRYIS